MPTSVDVVTVMKNYFGSGQRQNQYASTILKWMKITDNLYYNYYQFQDPSMLLGC